MLLSANVTVGRVVTNAAMRAVHINDEKGEKSLVMMSTANEVMGGGREQSVLHFGTALIRDFVVCRRCSPSANLT